MNAWGSKLGEQATDRRDGGSLADPYASKESAERGAQVQTLPVAAPKSFVCQEDRFTRLPDRAFGPSIPLIAQIVPSSHGFSRQVGHAEEETWANFLGLGEHPPKL